MRPPLRAVICDLDGLLFDSEVLTRSAWQAAARALGHDLDDVYFATLIGRRIAVSEADVATRFALDVAVFRSAWRAEHHRLASAGGALPKVGALALLGWLEERGIPRAVATSSIRSDALRTLGPVAARFQVVITGDQVSRGKPDPEIYLTAAAALGVPPDACAALEDSEPGIAAAHAAGMTPIMVPDLKQPDAATRARAWRVCASLVEARAELEALMGQQGY